MKKTISMLVLGLSALLIQPATAVAENITSLRGLVGVDEESEMIPNRRATSVDGGIEVSYEDQPPMIPHSIDKTRITLQAVSYTHLTLPTTPY